MGGCMQAAARAVDLLQTASTGAALGPCCPRTGLGVACCCAGSAAWWPGSCMRARALWVVHASSAMSVPSALNHLAHATACSQWPACLPMLGLLPPPLQLHGHALSHLPAHHCTRAHPPHPPQSILNNAGGDATEGFLGPQHPATVHMLVADFKIGTLAPGDS